MLTKKKRNLYKDESKLSKELNHNTLINCIKDNMKKCLYKKVLRVIISNEDIYQYDIQIKLLKIRAMTNIIQRKFNKYQSALEPQIPHINKYLELLQGDLLDIITLITSKGCQNNQISSYNKDSIIKYLLTFLSLKASLLQLIDKITEATLLLSICLKLITNYLPYSCSSNAYAIMQRVLMMISTLHIKNNDYKGAALYLNKAYKIGMQLVIYSTISKSDISNLTIDNNSNHIQQALVNIIIIMIQKGICSEHLGNLKVALQWYNKGHWITSKLLTKNKDLFMVFTHKLTSRSKDYIEILQYLTKKNQLLDEKKRLVLLQKKGITETDRKKTRIASGNYINYQKIAQSEKQIEQLIIPNDLFSPMNNTKKNYLSNIHLIDAYLSNDFKTFIDKSKQLNLADIDYRTKTKIESILNYSRPKSSIKKDLSYQASIQSSPMNFIYKSTLQKKAHNKTALLSRFDSSLLNNCSIVNQTKRSPAAIFEYKKSYKKKRMFLEQLNSKELQFQKELLKMKRGNSFRGETLNKHETIQEANFFFQRLLFENEYMTNLHGKKIKAFITLEEIKKLKKFMSLESRALKSLSPVELQKFMCEKKKQSDNSLLKKNKSQINLVKSSII